MQSLAKYLRLHAAAECRLLSALPGKWQQALVIPAYRETVDLLDGLLPAVRDRTLIVLVLNRPRRDSDTEWATTLVHALGTASWRRDHLALFNVADNADVLAVDRCVTGPPLDDREGVGGARRIGADLVCRLIADGRIRSPWIFNSDADALLPGDYFAAPETAGFTAACVYPFSHVFENDERSRWPTLAYEWHLHHYVTGLRRAGSPYAWHTVGSTIAVHHAHYAAVRGFPRRSGGEDFYLLNKLAKTGAVCSLRGPIIHLRARRSERVPFGTGPATARIEALPGPAAFHSYHPAGFDYLAELLQWLEISARRGPLTARDFLRRHAQRDIDPDLLARLSGEIGVHEALARAARDSEKPQQRRRHLHQWFDGFRTLKWLHRLRDGGLGERPLPALVRHPWYSPLVDDADRPLEDVLADLNPRLRNALADGAVRGAL